MDKLFTISGVDFLAGDFQDDISEFQDIIPILQDFQEELKLEKIECTDENDCCFKTKENYICELVGALTEDDEFYSLIDLKMKCYILLEYKFINVQNVINGL